MPILSQTILIPHMYLNPVAAPMVDSEGRPVEYDKRYLKDHFEEFYEDAFEELSKFGEIEELNVCDNVNEHLLGNVYVKYRTEDCAESAMKALQGRYYAGRLLLPEFSPVTDFHIACCKDFEESECTRGGLCNFLHLKPVSKSLRKDLFKEQRKRFKKRKRSESRSRSRSKSKEKSNKKNSSHHNSNNVGSQGPPVSNNNSAPPAPARPVRCYNCSALGHSSKDCPKKQGF
eukprot:NODE_5741_length_974_cov_44.037603_g5160_i0.p1 GENE.NODE_5741_length_974_cov_44.037603_g5160_i0~~NODE_5741_length_974_cov_44.037603_g5160_i0.p1  ORF type:complete len:231 (+),score=37.21 NODE_5741_length_974_cov_44.037603_g5160_i0:216-908(+)